MLREWFALLGVMLPLAASWPLAAAETPLVFTAPTIPEGTNVVTAPDGYVTLTWAPEDSSITNFFDVELQQAGSPDFNDVLTRYRGKDRSTHISGLPAGDFYFRVRTMVDTNQPGPWSEALPVRVNFISFKTVTLLLSLGAVVFLATVAAVVTGHRKTRGEATGVKEGHA